MKLTTLLLVLSLMQVSAATLGQQITLNKKNVPLETVLKDIRDQSGYGIFFNEKIIPSQTRVDINITNATVEQALDLVLPPLDLTYEINGKVITISKKPAGLLDKIKAAFTTKDVHGTVVDEKGQPVPGATVKLKDNSQATVTDAAGSFTLKQVSENAVIVVSFIGYKPKEIPVSENLDKIQLQVSTSGLDEVKVVAYGETTQRFDLGNVVSVKAADIEKQNVTNPLLALQGRVPGLVITQATGFPNSGLSVHIQGQNSIANGTDPFYVVDGVPYPSSLGLTVVGVTGGFSPLAFINPADIESISVLKDADATAIYGSQAANGAIVITTKKGKFGPTQVQASVNHGGNLPADEVPLLNSQQYIAMRKEAYANAGRAVPANAYDINGFWDQSRYTDWQKVLIGNAQDYTTANLSVSGGTASAHYDIGGTYTDTRIPLPTTENHFADRKASLHFNVGTTSANQKFKIELTGNYMYDLNKLPNFDPSTRAVLLAPDAPSLYNPDGSLNWALDANGNSTWITGNQIANLLNIYTVTSRNLVSNLQMSYKLLRGLNASLSTGYTNMAVDEFAASPLASVPPNQRPYSFNNAQYGYTNNGSWNIDPLLQYQTAWKKHDLSILAGGNYLKEDRKQTSYFGFNYPTDAAMTDIALAQYPYFNNPSATIYQYTALFSRLNYRYNNEFLLDANWRRDGSSRYGDNNKFHSFWSVGAGWIFTETELFKKHLSVLSYGKFRVNYGTTGSDQIGDYSYLSQYFPSIFGVPYAGINTLSQGGLSNPYLEWEDTRKLNFGIDLGFLKDRIVLSANYYRNRSTNEIVDQGLPSTTGFVLIAENFNALVQNTGLELTLNIKNIQKANFTWNTSITFGENRNKLLSFNGLDQTNYSYSLIVGHSLNLTRLYNYAGVNPQTGLYQFRAKDGTLTSNPTFGVDNYIIRDQTPGFSMSMGNSINYHRLSLDLMFTFMKQVGPNWRRGFQEPGNNHFNEPVTVLSHWQKAGDISDVQRFDVGAEASNTWSEMQGSTGGVTDASYLRLKTVALSFRILSNKTFKNLEISGQAQNIFTISKYLGDPETMNYHSLSGLRTFSLGLRTTL